MGTLHIAGDGVLHQFPHTRQRDVEIVLVGAGLKRPVAAHFLVRSGEHDDAAGRNLPYSAQGRSAGGRICVMRAHRPSSSSSARSSGWATSAARSEENNVPSPARA